MPDVNGSEVIVKKLARARARLDTQLDEIEEALSEAMCEAYKDGTTAIRLAELTGFGRQNIYDRLKRGGSFSPQQPKKPKKRTRKKVKS